MKTLRALSNGQADEKTKAFFGAIQQKIGRVPNLYAAMGNSPQLLGGFLAFSETLGKGVFSAKEQEAISLAVSQVNGCQYCLSAHTALAKIAGFTEAETLDLRKGSILDDKLNPLTNLAMELTEKRGNASPESVKRFYAAGYDETALAELIGLVGLRIIANYIFSHGDFDIDFPKATSISSMAAAA